MRLGSAAPSSFKTDVYAEIVEGHRSEFPHPPCGRPLPRAGEAREKRV